MTKNEFRMTDSFGQSADIGLLHSSLLILGLCFSPEALFAEEQPNAPQRFEFSEPHMGAPFSMVLYASDEQAANRAVAAAYSRIRQLDQTLSDFDSDSELRRVCRTAGTGQPVRLSSDLWQMLAQSQRLAEMSEGAFDVTVGPVVKLWRRARRKQTMPDADRLHAALASVGYHFVQLDPVEKTCLLKELGMRLDLGGIAKGFAADEALAVLQENGCPTALVNAGGDIVLGDPPPGRAGWKIGIAPLEPDSPPSRFLLLERCAVATSGDAWQFVEIDGQRYSHIIDPRTGIGLRRRSSVTVVAGDGAMADGLASAVSVLGPEKGLEFLENFSGVEASIVYLEDGKAKLRETQGIAKLESGGLRDSKVRRFRGGPAGIKQACDTILQE